jgi:hypothetical protein
MTRRDYRSGPPRSAHHPKQQDALPVRAWGRPGTQRGGARSGDLFDTVGRGCRRSCSRLSHGRVAPGASGGHRRPGRRLARQIAVRLRASGRCELTPFRHGTRSTVEPRLSARLVAPTPWPERIIFGDSAASSPPAAHSSVHVVGFGRGAGGRGAGMTVAVVEPSHTTWVVLAGRRVMSLPAPPTGRARAADPRGGSSPVVGRGPAMYTVHPIGAASARLMSPGRRGVHRDDTRLSRRLSCLANREPRTQQPRAVLSRPISHLHRRPAAPLRRDDQSGNVATSSSSTGGAPPASDTLRVGETAALTFHRRLNDIRADLSTEPHG